MKKAIHFNKEELKEVEQLVYLSGLANIYGAESKVIKFGITFALQQAFFWAKVLPDLNTSEGELFLSSVRTIQKQNKLRKDKELLEKKANL